MIKRMLPFVVLMACTSAPPDHAAPPDSVVGTYRYTGSGTVVGKFPWTAESDLVLDHDGQYTLTFTVHIDDEKGGDADTDEDYGSFYVDGDRIVLEPAGDDAGSNMVLAMNGKRLEPTLGWPARLAMKGFRIPSPVFVKTDAI